MLSLPLSGHLPQARLERVGLLALLGLGAAMLFSIAAAHILLGLTVLCWLCAPGWRPSSWRKRRD